MHVGAASPENVPGSHGRQAEGKVAPTSADAEPALQLEHVKAPGTPARKRPAAQTTGEGEAEADRDGVVEGVGDGDGERDGVELAVTDQKDDWLEITDGQRRVGWLKRDTLALLAP